MKFIVELANGENIKISKEEVQELVPSKGFKLGRIVLKDGKTFRLHYTYTASMCIWFLDMPCGNTAK